MVKDCATKSEYFIRNSTLLKWKKPFKNGFQSIYIRIYIFFSIFEKAF
jgi:hypothetical protein